jgi:hypothetical protein
MLVGRYYGIKIYKLNQCGRSDISAHVFGSGSSAIETRKLIDDKSHTFGCNLTLALLPKWDYGFVERLQDDRYGKMQMDILLAREFSKVIIKNNYPHKCNKNRSNIKLLLDEELPVFILMESQLIGEKNNLATIVSLILDNKASYITQYASSILTMIIFAVRSGYTEIVLHGVDFGGKSFYDSDEFSMYQYITHNASTAVHQTDTYTVPFRAVLDEVILRLGNKGINVMYAKDLI